MDTDASGPSSKERCVLIAVDDSQACEGAVDWAIGHFYRPGDVFHLTHVISETSNIDPYYSDVNLNPLKKALLRGRCFLHTHGLHKVEFGELEEINLVTALTNRAIDFIEKRFVPKLVSGEIPFKIDIVRKSSDDQPVGEAIVRYAHAVQTPAIIMAKHDKGLKKFFMGSVAKYVSEHAAEPVVILK